MHNDIKKPAHLGHSKGSPENSVYFCFGNPLASKLGWYLTCGVIWLTVVLFGSPKICCESCVWYTGSSACFVTLTFLKFTRYREQYISQYCSSYNFYVAMIEILTWTNLYRRTWLFNWQHHCFLLLDSARGRSIANILFAKKRKHNCEDAQNSKKKSTELKSFPNDAFDTLV